MTSWHSYPKVWNFGHTAVRDILADTIHVEEKIDGSQFSFGCFNGELKVRSKGQEMLADAPEKMFLAAVETVKGLDLRDGWTYRAEYLSKPKHNILAYQRVPEKFLILFDVNIGEEEYLPYAEKKIEADRLGLECVACLYDGIVTDSPQLYNILETESVLGGQKVEGVVVKNYKRFGPDKKALMAKHVSERFKEKHKEGWKEMNPQSGDILLVLGQKYKSQVRWEKAVQHLRELGKITDSPKDIGDLIKEVKSDSLIECKTEVMEDLFRWAWPQLDRQLSKGFPEWYKGELLKKQFEKDAS